MAGSMVECLAGKKVSMTVESLVVSMAELLVAYLVDHSVVKLAVR